MNGNLTAKLQCSHEGKQIRPTLRRPHGLDHPYSYPAVLETDSGSAYLGPAASSATSQPNQILLL